MLWDRVLAILQKPELVKWQVLLWMFVFGWYDCAKKYHDLTYASETKQTKHHQASGFERRPRVGSQSLRLWLPRRIDLIRWPQIKGTRRSSLGQLQWSQYPQIPWLFTAARNFSILWWIYVIIKYTLSDQIDHWLRLFVELELPIHCYLMGRFIVVENLAEVTAALISAMCLAWTLSQLASRPMRMDVIYFLLQSQHDLNLVYSKFGPATSRRMPAIAMSYKAEAQLEARELFLVNTLCYRIACVQGSIFRLRANRTHDSHLRLRRLIARMTAINVSLLLIAMICIWTAFTFLHLDDRRYLRIYSNCDPELERLNSLGMVGRHLTRASGHRLLAILMDYVENTALWTSMGLFSFLSPLVIILFNYDLVLCWEDIEQTIEEIDLDSRGILLMESRPSLPVSDTLKRVKQTKLNRRRELVRNMADFYQQVTRVNAFLSRMLDCAVVGVLGLCAIYTYYLRTKSIYSVPWTITLVASVTSATTAIGSCGFWLVQRACARTYTRLCGMMARDQMKAEIRLEATIDYYVRRRDCFLILNQYPFRPTTFLTLVGWTFSCFCIISEVMSRSRSG